MSCPAALFHIAVRQAVSISWSSAPLRSRARRLVSSVANRQLRTCPSAVSRVRPQAEQNASDTEAMIPTVAGPPSTSHSRAGADLARGGVWAQLEVGPQRREDLAGPQCGVPVPPVLGVQWHSFDDAQSIAVPQTQPQQIDGVLSAVLGIQNRVDLDRM